MLDFSRMCITGQSVVMLWLVFMCLIVVSGSGQEPDEFAGLEVEAAESKARWTREGLERSREMYIRLASRFATLGRNREHIESRVAAAQIDIHLGKHQQALSDLKQSRRLAEKQGLRDLRTIIDSQLSLLLFDLGQTRASKEALDRVSKERESSHSQLAVGWASFSVAEHCYFNVELDKAIEHYQRAIESWSRVYPAGEVRALLGYGYVLLRQDRNAEGREAFTRAHRLAVHIGDVRGQAVALKAIGSALNNLNQKRSALAHYLEAERLFPNDIDLTEHGIVYNGIGSIYEFYSEWKEALRYKKLALDLFVRDNYIYGQLATLSNMGTLSFLSGDLTEAENYLIRARALALQLGNRYQLGIILEESGTISLERGDRTRALNELVQARKIFEELGNKRQLSSVLGKIGWIEFQNANYETSRYLLGQSLELGSTVRNEFHIAENLFRMSQLELATNRPREAERLLAESVRLTDSLSRDVLNAALRQAYRSSSAERYSALITAQMTRSKTQNNQGAMGEALITLERFRAHRLLDSLVASNADFIADADPAAAQREKEIRVELNAKSDTLIDLLSSHQTTKEQRETLESEISALRHELEGIKAELKEKSPVYSGITEPPHFDLAFFQAHILGDDSILLEYFLGTEESYLWIIGKNHFEAYVLPAREVIEKKVDQLKGLIEARRPTPDETRVQMHARIAEADARYIPLARELSEMILGPAHDKLAGKRLIIVPDGKLHHLAINVLPLPNQESNEPLLLTNEVVYQPSAQTLALLTKFRSTVNGERSRDLLVFSDPVFSKTDPRLAGAEMADAAQNSPAFNLRFAESLEGLQRLPASGQEAETIATIVDHRRTDIFSSFRATREHLLNANLADYKIIHLATHGLVNQERPELSAVVLSRFDESGQPLDHSVRLQDIYSMKLHADLVVLSACQTAAGKEVKGEGVMGLNSAFLQAGARSVVASLWQVEDNATNLLMKEFYQGMAEGLSTSAALRQAQIALYRDPQFRSPFFWAAFTLQGDMNGRPEIGSTLPHWRLVGVPVIFLLGLVAWRRFGRREFKRVIRP